MTVYSLVLMDQASEDSTGYIIPIVLTLLMLWEQWFNLGLKLDLSFPETFGGRFIRNANER